MSQKDFVVWKICLETRIQASKAVKPIGSKVVKLGGYAFAPPSQTAAYAVTMREF
jgi:hypothetical protein